MVIRRGSQYSQELTNSFVIRGAPRSGVMGHSSGLVSFRQDFLQRKGYKGSENVERISAHPGEEFLTRKLPKLVPHKKTTKAGLAVQN